MQSKKKTIKEWMLDDIDDADIFAYNYMQIVGKDEFEVVLMSNEFKQMIQKMRAFVALADIAMLSRGIEG